MGCIPIPNICPHFFGIGFVLARRMDKGVEAPPQLFNFCGCTKSPFTLKNCFSSFLHEWHTSTSRRLLSATAQPPDSPAGMWIRPPSSQPALRRSSHRTGSCGQNCTLSETFSPTCLQMLQRLQRLKMYFLLSSVQLPKGYSAKCYDIHFILVSLIMLRWIHFLRTPPTPSPQASWVECTLNTQEWGRSKKPGLRVGGQTVLRCVDQPMKRETVAWKREVVASGPWSWASPGPGPSPAALLRPSHPPQVGPRILKWHSWPELLGN